MNKELLSKCGLAGKRKMRNVSIFLYLSLVSGCLAQVPSSSAQPSTVKPDSSCPITNALTIEAYKTLARMSYHSYQGGDNQSAADLADALWVTVGQSRRCLVRAGVSEEEAAKLDDLTHSFCRPLRWYKYHNEVVANRDGVTRALQELTQELMRLK